MLKQTRMYQEIPWEVKSVFNIKVMTSVKSHAAEDFSRNHLSTLFCLWGYFGGTCSFGQVFLFN